jgi:hypothetical protein
MSVSIGLKDFNAKCIFPPMLSDNSVISMKSPCETVAKYILPVFRALVAKELMEKYGYSQNQVASKLGITQAAVSHYINSKRGSLMLAEIEKIDGVKETVQDVSTSIAKDNDNDAMVLAFCKLCSIVKASKVFWDNFEGIKKVGSAK